MHRRRVFTELDSSESSRPYLLVLLRHLARGTTLLVSSTHLKAKLGPEIEELRAVQVAPLQPRCASTLLI